jgi:hypothetical protein
MIGDFTVAVVYIDSFTLDLCNAHKHGTRYMDATTESLAEFGQRQALVITHDGNVIAGNGRS